MDGVSKHLEYRIERDFVLREKFYQMINCFDSFYFVGFLIFTLFDVLESSQDFFFHRLLAGDGTDVL